MPPTPCPWHCVRMWYRMDEMKGQILLPEQYDTHVHIHCVHVHVYIHVHVYALSETHLIIMSLKEEGALGEQNMFLSYSRILVNNYFTNLLPTDMIINVHVQGWCTCSQFQHQVTPFSHEACHSSVHTNSNKEWGSQLVDWQGWWHTGSMYMYMYFRMCHSEASARLHTRISKTTQKGKLRWAQVCTHTPKQSTGNAAGNAQEIVATQYRLRNNWEINTGFLLGTH